MFFVYFGGGAQGMAASLALLLFSVAMNGGGMHNVLDGFAGVGGDGAGPGWEPRSHRGRRRRQHEPQEEPETDWNHYSAGPGPRQQAAMASGRPAVWFSIATSLLILAIFACGYAMRHYPNNLAVRRLRLALLSLQDAVERCLRANTWQWQAGGGFGRDGRAAGPGHSDDQRQRASAAQVSALPTERFASRAVLLRWSAAELKGELQKLHRHAAAHRGYDGGKEARETEALLRGGVGVEKGELVDAVMKARGGESGQSCTICLADYEDEVVAGGAESTQATLLRVLPCGHRFHCDCVDRWLIEQSCKCPLCSASV